MYINSVYMHGQKLNLLNVCKVLKAHNLGPLPLNKVETFTFIALLNKC